MCWKWLRRRSSNDSNFTPKVQRDSSFRFLYPNTGPKSSVIRKKVTEIDFQQDQTDSVPGISPAELADQSEGLSFKRRLERNSADRFEYFQDSMSKWQANNAILSDHQIKQIHEKFKKDSCNAFRSIFFDYFNSNDSSKEEMLRDTYIRLEAKINATLNKYLETTSINIGIYLDENSVIIATTKNFREPEIIQKLPPEIAFLEEKVTIGKNAGYQQGNHFNIRDLIKSSPSGNQSVYFHIPTPSNPNNIDRYTITSEEITAIYFEKLLSEVKSFKRVDAIGNVVITVPFAMTSFEKSRLQLAMKMAGCPDVRITSSLLSTAVVYVGDIGYHLKTMKTNKVVLVAQYSESSFSMAMIEVTSNGIIPRTCTGLENMTEGQDKSFLHAHQLLFNNESATNEEEEYVTRTYERALRYLSSEVQSRKLDGVILIEETKNGTGISDIFKKIFNNKLRVRLVSEGPLAGACFLASRTEVSSLIIPPHVRILDASRANLNVSSGIKEWEVNFRNKAFQPGIAFSLPIVVPPGNGCSVNLTEVYLKGHVFSLVGQYQISVKNQKVMTDQEVVLHFWMTEDGVLTVGGDLKNTLAGGYVRVESTLGKETNSFGSSQLLLYYKTITDGKSKYPHTHQEEPIMPPPEEKTSAILPNDFESFVRDPSPILDVIEEENDSFTEETLVSCSSSSTNESPPEFPTSVITPDPSSNPAHFSEVKESICPTFIDVVKETMSTAVEEAEKAHRVAIYKITDQNDPFTDKQILEYHRQILSQAKTVLNDVFSPILQVSSDVDATVGEAEDELSKRVNLQIPTFLKRHEVKIEGAKNTLRRLTLEGESFYDDTMEAFEPGEKTMQEVVAGHSRLVTIVKGQFKEKVLQHGIEWHEDLSKELDMSLEEKLQDLCEELKENVEH